jgi:hypothetical protein
MTKIMFWTIVIVSTIFGLASQISVAKAETVPDLLCSWTIKDKKKGSEDTGVAPCTETTINGTKFFASVFTVQGRKFRIENLAEEGGAEPVKAKFNGKIGTKQEDNRYGKHFMSDDLSIQFQYDTILDDPKLTKAKIQGVWADNLNKCKHSDDPSNYIIKGNTLTRFGGESQCKIYQVGVGAVTNVGKLMMKCDNEGEIDYQSLGFEFFNNRGAYIGQSGHYYRCPR